MDETQIRTPVLMQLAEQVMSDAAFRAAAAEDLGRALADAGYDLNEPEMALVMQFRTALRDAGVDVFLKEQSLSDLRSMLSVMDAEDLTALASQLRGTTEQDAES
ncbi:MAG: hypothetical protein QM753_08650 [Thermomicrobiales bacterium]